jgi:hypothetical protein
MESTAATEPACCEIDRLPEDLLLASLARTSAPRDLPPLADGELPASPDSVAGRATVTF